jgi:hypothetical protein
MNAVELVRAVRSEDLHWFVSENADVVDVKCKNLDAAVSAACLSSLVHDEMYIFDWNYKQMLYVHEGKIQLGCDYKSPPIKVIELTHNDLVCTKSKIIESLHEYYKVENKVKVEKDDVEKPFYGTWNKFKYDDYNDYGYKKNLKYNGKSWD